ncbi:beta-ketoacyl-ACP synthase II [Clostridium sp.]|uniref:beta-ketoacyl-ACP synthase II n=1 Tax=Clostridium sp. TaxID=1506 RepID=UPI003216A2A3
MENRRVVITGLGSITPMGLNSEELWQGLKNGRCCVDDITRFDTEKFKTKLACEVKDFDPTLYMDKKEARRMDRFTQFAIAASKEAVDNSALNLDIEDSERIGVIIGSGIGGIETFEREHRKYIERGPGRISPLTVPMMIANIVAGNVAIKYGAKAMCTTVVTACASGTNSIGEAFRNIKYDLADIMITGGAEASITPFAIGGFENMTALSFSQDKNRATIPFDKERNGFVMGEGSGILILEELNHAINRGATIYGEIVGYGATCDAYHITSPALDGNGAKRAMELAIKEGNIDKSEISYINAHGTSTPYNDKLETLAIKNLLGEDAKNVPISSTKSMIGHLLGASGAVESIACIKSLQDGFIHPTAGLQVHDEECDLDYVPNIGREANLKYVLCNSLGFGGHNASLLFKKYE